MIAIDVEPLSEEWFYARLGVLTMSRARDLMTGGEGVTRRNYILDVASEVISGTPVERFQSDDMLRGLELEPFALEAHGRERGFISSKRIGFAYLDERRTIGCSPDGIIRIADGGGHGVEVKCPIPRTHLRYLDQPSRPNHHYAQIQGNMWIFNATSWDFVSFCPEFVEAPLLIHTIERDQEYIDQLEESTENACEEIVEIVAKIADTEYRADLEDIVTRAARHIEMIKAAESDLVFLGKE